MARLPGIQVAEQPKTVVPEPDTGAGGFFDKMKRMKVEMQLQVRKTLNTWLYLSHCCSGGAGQCRLSSHVGCPFFNVLLVKKHVTMK